MTNNLEKLATSRRDKKRAIEEGFHDYGAGNGGEDENDKPDTIRKKERMAWAIRDMEGGKLGGLEDAAVFKRRMTGYEDEYGHEYQKNGGEDKVSQIYKWYKEAILRRGGKPLDFQDFDRDYFGGSELNKNYIFGDLNRGYLFGPAEEGILVVTHFAAKNSQEELELIRDLGKNKKIPIILIMPEDLTDAVRDIPGWKILDLSSLKSFIGGIAEKNIAHNDHPDVKELAERYFKKYGII